MISSRRYAREWALKILYQADVGKIPLREARAVSMERLRMEFVHRGSRSVSGSQLEEICLDSITAPLADSLPMMRPALERAVTAHIGAVLAHAPGWQSNRFRDALKAKLRISSTSRSRPRNIAVTAEPCDGVISERLSEVESLLPGGYLAWTNAELPANLDQELKLIAKRDAAEVFGKSARGEAPDLTSINLDAARSSYEESCCAWWSRVGQIVQKQTADWLRVAGFVVRLLELIEKQGADVDVLLTALSSGWRLERQVSVDRNILRIAAVEMLFVPEIPASASINEAVELAKKYSTAESSRFVNGVLGALAARQSAAAESPAGFTEDVLIDDEIIDADDALVDTVPVTAQPPEEAYAD